MYSLYKVIDVCVGQYAIFGIIRNIETDELQYVKVPSYNFYVDEVEKIKTRMEGRCPTDLVFEASQENLGKGLYTTIINFINL